MIHGMVIGILKTGPIPKHIAFVMDGNRRYAQGKQLMLKEGHTAGAETLVDILDTSYRLGIKAVTIYAFSIENFNRPQLEIDTIFQLLRDNLVHLSSADEYADKNEVKVRIIGHRALIPDDIMPDLIKVEEMTLKNTKHLLNVCFPYTSRDDITHCIQTVVNDVINEHKYEISDVTEELLNNNMYLGDEYPNVDIMVRTSGHTRLSDFMLWQTNQNSVIIFDNTLWPDFHSFNLFWHILTWSYHKTMQLHEAQLTAPNNSNHQPISFKDLNHPPYASVTGK